MCGSIDEILNSGEIEKAAVESKLKKIVKTLHNIDEKKIRENYEIIYNQLCVLAVSALSATLKRLFKRQVEENPEKIQAEKVEDLEKFDLKELQDLGFDIRDDLPQLILERGNNINFQDLKSIKQTFKIYCGAELNIPKEVEKNVILYHQYRHTIVHNNAEIDNRFLGATGRFDYGHDFNLGDKIILNDQNWKVIQKNFIKLVDVIENCTSTNSN